MPNQCPCFIEFSGFKDRYGINLTGDELTWNNCPPPPSCLSLRKHPCQYPCNPSYTSIHPPNPHYRRHHNIRNNTTTHGFPLLDPTDRRKLAGGGAPRLAPNPLQTAHRRLAPPHRGHKPGAAVHQRPDAGLWRIVCA